MFLETLIEIVRTHGPKLFDKAFEEYKNRQENFDKVAAELNAIFNINTTGKGIMNQWDSLYKSFRDVHNRIQNAPSGSAATATEIKFAYYDQMRFVESSLHYRQPLSSLQNTYMSYSDKVNPTSLPASSSVLKYVQSNNQNLASTSSGNIDEPARSSIWQHPSAKASSYTMTNNPCSSSLTKLNNTWEKAGKVGRGKKNVKTPALDKFASKKLSQINQTQDILASLNDLVNKTSENLKDSFVKPPEEDNLSIQDPNILLVIKNYQNLVRLMKWTNVFKASANFLHQTFQYNSLVFIRSYIRLLVYFNYL